MSIRTFQRCRGMMCPNLDRWICSPLGSYLTILQLRISWFLCVLLQHCARRDEGFTSPPSLLRTLCCSRAPKTGLLWAREEVFTLWITIWLATVSTFFLVSLRAAYCRNLTALSLPFSPLLSPTHFLWPSLLHHSGAPFLRLFSLFLTDVWSQPPSPSRCSRLLSPTTSNKRCRRPVCFYRFGAGVSLHGRLTLYALMKVAAQMVDFYLRVPISVAMRSLFVFPLDGESGTFFFFLNYFFFTLSQFYQLLSAGQLWVRVLLLLGMFCSWCGIFSW